MRIASEAVQGLGRCATTCSSKLSRSEDRNAPNTRSTAQRPPQWMR
ncbi:MAG: hypothetical protein COB33_009890 [Thiotrichaceae bacterium]|nr:hypothetical protein [Thiotrichaceae bacterium]